MSDGSDPGTAYGRSTAGIDFGVVTAFATAWESTGRPPRIADYLPAAEVLRLGALLELIRVDLRHRWLHQISGVAEDQDDRPVPKRLHEYCAEFPELAAESIPAGLVYEEFVIRRHSGERIDPRDCLAEYPAQANRLRELLNADEEDQSTRRADFDPATGTVTVRPGATGQTGHAGAEPSYPAGTDTPHPAGTQAYIDGMEISRSAGTETVTSAATVTSGPARIGNPGGSATWTGELTRATADLTAATTTGRGLSRIEIGQQVDDFDLLTELGSGAFARVFLARQRSLQRLVAVKISANRGTEPQTLAQLDHDYIVRVFDQRLLDDGDPAAARRLRLLYMQFLPGGTLLGVLRWVRATPPDQRSGQLLLDAVDAAMEEKGEIRPTDSSVRAEIATLSWPETVAWLGRRLAEALAYADGEGVLHRDVKPANVLLTAEAVPKLADFNISFSRTVAGTSPVAYFGGSLSYMSPEQLEACHPGYERSPDDLDTRADIFSLGVVLWELLTGSKPFDDTTAADRGDVTALAGMLDTRRAGIGTVALDRLPPDCPAALRRVLLTCLATDRDRRWKSGSELAKQLQLCLDQRARDLVDPPPGSWRLRLRSWLIPVLVLSVGLPNVAASAFNIQHNRSLIIDRLSPSAQHAFLIVTGLVNGVFFPMGIAVLVYLSRSLLGVSHGLLRGRSYPQRALARARSDALLMGDRAVLVAFSLWVLAAIIFPVTLQVTTGEVTLPVVVHFLTSLVVCGAMAVAYPFFLVNFYLVRCIYPLFFWHGEIDAGDTGRLRGLDRRSAGYLAVAASVPLLAVAGVTFLPPADIPHVIVAVRVLCVGGIVAFVVAYLLFRSLEADLRALQRVTDPTAADTEPGPELAEVVPT